MTILLLEDDLLFASSLVDFLEEENYIITHTNNSNEFFKLTYNNRYDLYLLDINVPVMNGLELLSNLRQSDDNTPTIFLTSYKDKQTLKDGFSCGADDFLVKPFDSEELLLRIGALLKRVNKSNNNIKINNIIYNYDKRCFIQNNEPIYVSKKVIDLFLLFLNEKNKIITKELIINTLWSSNQDYSDGAIRVYISKLKDILGKESIINIKGQGYKSKF